MTPHVPNLDYARLPCNTDPSVVLYSKIRNQLQSELYKFSTIDPHI
jgi:hypothetical protein